MTKKFKDIVKRNPEPAKGKFGINPMDPWSIKSGIAEATDKKDRVTLDIPLLIRVLELAREDIKTDMDLHRVVEKLIQIRNKGVLTMKDYNTIAHIKENHIAIAMGKMLDDEGGMVLTQLEQLERAITMIRSYVGKDYEKQLPAWVQAKVTLATDYVDTVGNYLISKNEKVTEAKDPCWTGYTQVGMKKKGGRQVPNCVPSKGVPKAKGYKEEVMKCKNIKLHETKSCGCYSEEALAEAQSKRMSGADKFRKFMANRDKQNREFMKGIEGKSHAEKMQAMMDKIKSNLNKEEVELTEDYDSKLNGIANKHGFKKKDSLIGVHLEHPKHGRISLTHAGAWTHDKPIHSGEGQYKGSGMATHKTIHSGHGLNNLDKHLSSLSEEVDLEEAKQHPYKFRATYHDPDTNEVTHYMDFTHRNLEAAKKHAQGSRLQRRDGKEDKLHSVVQMKEEVEKIDELNYDTVKSLYQKRRADFHGAQVGKKKKGKDVSAKNVSTSISRMMGYKPTQNQPQKEEVEKIDELKKTTVKSWLGQQKPILDKKPGEERKAYNTRTKKRSVSWNRALDRLTGHKPTSEDVFQDPQAATQTVFDGANNTNDTSNKKKQLSKSARIVKSLYKHHNMKEDTYDWEKDDKNQTSYGKKPKVTKDDEKSMTGGNKPQARAVLSGGTTLTGDERDTLEIDPMMKNRPDLNGTVKDLPNKKKNKINNI